MAEEGDLGSLKLGLVAYFKNVRPEIQGLKSDLNNLKSETEKTSDKIVQAGPQAEESFGKARTGATGFGTALRAIGPMIVAIGAGMAAVGAVRLGKSFLSGIIKESDEGAVRLRFLADRVGDVGEAGRQLDEVDKLVRDMGIDADEAADSFNRLSVFLDAETIKSHFIDIANAAKVNTKSVSEMVDGIIRLNEGIVSSRVLLALGISKEDLAKKNIMFDGDQIKSDAKTVAEAVLQIWHEKFTLGAGKDISTVSEFLMTLKNYGRSFLEMIGNAGFYQAIKDNLSVAAAKVKEWFDAGKADEWGKKISGWLTIAWTTVSQIIAALTGIAMPSLATPVPKGDIEKQQKNVADLQRQYDDLMATLNNGVVTKENPTFASLLDDINEIGPKLIDAKTNLDNLIDTSKRGEGGKGVKLPDWAEALVNAAKSVNEAITDLYRTFEGKDYRGSDRGGNHGIESGFEAVGKKIGESLSTAISNIDWGKLISNIFNNAKTLTEIANGAEAIGGALGDGIVAGLKAKYPNASAILRAAGLLIKVLNPLGLASDFENAVTGDGYLPDGRTE